MSVLHHTLGLSTEEAAARLASDGYNELPAPERRGFGRIVWEVVRQPMFALLIGGVVVYLHLGDRIEALLLLAFATLSVLITVVQESRSEGVLEALRDLASPWARAAWVHRRTAPQRVREDRDRRVFEREPPALGVVTGWC
jgi:Ca2+-transporting ATPase